MPPGWHIKRNYAMKEAHQAEAALLRTLYSMRVQPLLVFEEAAQ
jgi:hypothetical protein